MLKKLSKKIGIALLLLFALYMGSNEILHIIIPRSRGGEVLGFDLAKIALATFFFWAAKTCWQALGAKPSDKAAEPSPQNPA